MKRSYIQPTCKVREIALCTMIAESPGGLLGTMGDTGTDTGNPENNLAKDDIFGTMDLNRAMEILDEFDW